MTEHQPYYSNWPKSSVSQTDLADHKATFRKKSLEGFDERREKGFLTRRFVTAAVKINPEITAKILAKPVALEEIVMAHGYRMGHRKLGWLIAQLDTLDDNQLTKILSVGQNAFILAEGGQRRWLTATIDRLNNDQRVKILSAKKTIDAMYQKVPEQYMPHEYGIISDWLLDKFDQLDDEQLTKVLSASGVVSALRFTICLGKQWGLDWAKEKLAILSDEQVTQILTTDHAVYSLAMSTKADWLVKRISKFEDDQLAQILSSAGAVNTLANQGQGKWLIRTLEKMDPKHVEVILKASYKADKEDRKRGYRLLDDENFIRWRADKTGALLPAGFEPEPSNS